MRRMALALLATAALCSGQTCSGLPDFPPAGLAGPIPAGVYSGDVTYGGLVSTNGAVIADFEPLVSPYSCEFGSEGILLVDADTNMAVGDVVVTSFDDNATTMTVKAIRSVGGELTVDYNVVMKYRTGSTTVDATGYSNESFWRVSGGGLKYAFTMSVDFRFESTPIRMTVTGDGLLHR